ncbi:MAG: aldehyde dehydrogenase family protein, partial [Bacteroidota bacterium]
MNFKTEINYRRQSLIKLLNCVQLYEQEIIKALYDDFKKPAFEAVLSETAYIVAELNYTIRNINKWAKPQLVLPSLLNFPSTDYIYKEPYGKVLIIAPWNYPYQLALCPLIAAVAAGNQVTVKPSELTPNTSGIVAKIISEAFNENHVKCVEGGVEITQKLLSQRWDYIFFTGSVTVGKIVAKAAAENLTPVTLELGGKNPCIVDETADIKLAAKRIVWGKFLNAGQTCIAPDYLLVSDKIKHAFIEALK